MRKRVAALIVVGAIGLSGRSALASPPPGQSLNLTELGPTVFLPLDSTTTYTTNSPATFLTSFGRYPTGGTLATLAVALDSSRIPDGSHIKKVCFYYFDNNPSVDMTAGIIQVNQPTAGGQTSGPVNIGGFTVSSGTPGYGVSCFDVDVPINYEQTVAGTDVLADYFLGVSFGTLGPIATDGSISLQRVAVYWKP